MPRIFYEQAMAEPGGKTMGDRLSDERRIFLS